MTKLFRILTLTALLFATPALAAQTPIGIWSMGKVTVKVVNCGGGLCANIVALKEPISKIDGKPKVDRENPNPAMRNRPLIGLAVISGMKPAGEAAWQGALPSISSSGQKFVMLDWNRLNPTKAVKNRKPGCTK